MLVVQLNYSDDAASFIPSKEGTVFKDGQDLTIVNGVVTAQRAKYGLR